MAAFTTEVFIFETRADSFDPELTVPALKLTLEAAQGVHAPIFYGAQIENANMGNVFLNWDSYEARMAFIDTPAYSPIGEVLGPSLQGKKAIYHVIFSAPVTVALQTPVTEVLVLSLKAPENRAAVVGILTTVSQASKNMLVFGQTREDENKYILIGGWPSVEAHLEMVAKPEVKGAFDALYSLANEDHHYHTKLLQYTL